MGVPENLPAVSGVHYECHILAGFYVKLRSLCKNKAAHGSRWKYETVMKLDFPVWSSSVTAVGKNMYTNGRILKEERHMLSSDVRAPAMPLLNIFKGVRVD
jgi:hypothetical protein